MMVTTEETATATAAVVMAVMATMNGQGRGRVGTLHGGQGARAEGGS